MTTSSSSFLKLQFFAALLVLQPCRAANLELTAESILADIESVGAKKVVGRLDVGYGSDNDYERVLNQIATGKKEWLKVAEKLRPGTDASTGEALCDYVAKAIPKNPKGVLMLIHKKTFEASGVCTAPFYEGTPRNVIVDFKKEAVEALEKVRSRKLHKAKDECLGELK